jgi:hypothetical protein
MPQLILYPLAIGGILVTSCHQNTALASCDTPLSNWLRPSDGIGHLLLHNRVTVAADDKIRWNDRVITKTELAHLTFESGKLDPVPQIILQVSPKAKCEAVNAVRRTMNEAPICQNLKLCGEGQGWVYNGDIGAQSIPPEF